VIASTCNRGLALRVGAGNRDGAVVVDLDSRRRSIPGDAADHLAAADQRADLLGIDVRAQQRGAIAKSRPRANDRRSTLAQDLDPRLARLGQRGLMIGANPVDLQVDWIPVMPFLLPSILKSVAENGPRRR